MENSAQDVKKIEVAATGKTPKSRQKLFFICLILVIISCFISAVSSLFLQQKSFPELLIRVLPDSTFIFFIFCSLLFVGMKFKSIRQLKNMRSVAVKISDFSKFSIRLLAPIKIKTQTKKQTVWLCIAICLTVIASYATIFLHLEGFDLAIAGGTVPKSSENLALALAYNSLVAFTEEIAFRSMIFYLIYLSLKLVMQKGSFKHQYYIHTCVIYIFMSSVLFGISHLWKSDIGQIMIMVWATGLAATFILSRSIIIVFILHFFNNSIHVLFYHLNIDLNKSSVALFLFALCFTICACIWLTYANRPNTVKPYAGLISTL